MASDGGGRIDHRWFWIPTLLVAGGVLVFSAIHIYSGWIGLRAWTVSEFANVVQAFQWHHSISLLILAALLMFRREISGFIDDFVEGHFGDGKFSVKTRRRVVDDVVQAAVLQANPDEKLTAEYVRQRMAELRLVNRSSLSEVDEAYGLLLRRGIRTKGALDDLLRKPGLLEELARIYLQEFPRTREPDAPLDPLSIAGWGTILSEKGLTKSAGDLIREGLRRFPEWKENHPR